jgi:hypothetical protein
MPERLVKQLEKAKRECEEKWPLEEQQDEKLPAKHC